MADTTWDAIYARGEQLNRHPYSEVVSFFYRNAPPDRRTRRLTALDVGCGSGVHAAFMAGEGVDVLAIDASAQAIEAARSMHGAEGVEFEATSFDLFDPGERRFDLVVDRCSTTHSTLPVVEEFYRRLKPALAPGARIFWQGFAWDNSGRALGRWLGDGSWGEFTGGVFQPLGRTVFFREEDVLRVFEGYRLLRFRHLSDRDMRTGDIHSSWIVEAAFEG